MKYFQRLHPVAAFVYFLFMILLAMLSMHPVVISVCYLSGVVFCGMLSGFKNLLKSLVYSIPLTALIAITNPIFSHRGETVLFFLNDNPVTREAIIYGVFAALMLMGVFYWCRNYGTVMTSDKFIYLFGKIIPKLSLVLSLILAFIPKLKRRYREIDEAQKALGVYASKSYVDKIRSKMRVLSILLTNSLENAVDTADSMRARGYGLKHRTSFALYRFEVSDGIFLALSAVLGISSLAAIFLGGANFAFYPALSNISASAVCCVLYTCLAILGFMSLFLEVKENVLWRLLKSKI